MKSRNKQAASGTGPGCVAWCGFAGKKLDNGNLHKGVLPEAFQGAPCLELLSGELLLVCNQ
jgi:hypothetical protein